MSILKFKALKFLSAEDQVKYTQIDVGALIAQVSAHEILYRSDIPGHMSNSRKDAIWKTIGDNLNVDGNVFYLYYFI